MKSEVGAGLWSKVLVALWFTIAGSAGESFRVATFNVESYLDVATPTRVAKTAESKAKVREGILATQADVLALQELGGASALSELKDSLKRAGLDLPYYQLVSGSDTNIHLGLLSRFPFAAIHLYTNENFLLNGRRFHVSRGFIEAQIRVNSNYSFTLLGAHLKSKRIVAAADEAEVRLEEAKILREKIDSLLAKDPEANLVVLGDFNDTKDAASIRTVIGQGKTKLVDTRPAERNLDANGGPASAKETRRITWTHYYASEDSYRRIDYVLLSRGMAREWVPDQSYVLAVPGWGLASDHRPVVAAFETAGP